LFAVDGVTGVFFGSDFITVTKADGEWQHLKPALLGAIMEHFTGGAPVLYGSDKGEAASAHAEHEGEDAEIVREIKEVLDTRIRPAVAQDGGDITFQGFEAGIVYLNMQGSCAGCPSSTVTLKRGVENTLKHYVPEVVEVRAI
jgi:Fe-S cluster biogenesis protein NfuA